MSIHYPTGDGPPPSADLEYAFDRRALTSGNRVTVLRGGAETFPAMLRAIAAAKKYVCLETYILRSDDTGRRFGAALVDRARAGITVRLLFDSMGSRDIDPEFLRHLAAHGIEVAEYHPVSPWRRHFGLGRIARRDHRKILVVDGVVGFTGGLNIADEYAADEDGGGGWYDVHARVEGPVVAELLRLFRRSWVHAGGHPFRLPDQPSAESVIVAPAFATVLENRMIHPRMEIRRAYLHAIGEARRTVSIMNAYFLPDLGLRWALRKAARRGVSVRVVVPGSSDIPVVRLASRHLFSSLLAAGLRIFEWPGAMMHAKIAVIDGTWCAIGSYNLDYVSLFYNLEVVLAVVDREVGAEMDAQFEAALARSEEVESARWSRRSRWQRFVEWFFFRVRRWM